MRPLKRSALGVGVLLGGGTLLFGMMQLVGAGNLALASGTTSDARGMCSDATLHGTYHFATESVQEPGRGPAQHHLAVSPTLDVPGYGSSH